MQASAQRAQDLGLPSVAAELYQQLYDVPGADRARLGLLLATALLDAGDAAEAEKILNELPEPRGAAWRLRSGLAAMQLNQRARAQGHWDAIREADIAPEDLPWYRFFTGALWDTASPRDVTKANAFYVQAEEAAATPLARARFQLSAERLRLQQPGPPRESDLKQARDTARQFAGKTLGYDETKNLAVMLAKNGQRREAEESLRNVLVGLSPQQRSVRDELRFLLGMIGGRERGGVGRNALVQLLESGGNPLRQRQALELLAEASRDGASRDDFGRELDKLISAKPDHPILESLLFYRAQLALSKKEFAAAEADALTLVKQFPLSPLRVHAQVLLTQSAWEQGRYRFAAEYSRNAREAMVGPAGSEGNPGAAMIPARVRTDFGVLEAEAWFRAGDFRNAADAYSAVLRERPAEWEAKRVGELIFLRVLAEIKAEPEGAGRVLDDLRADPAFDLENRWQAEWSLARALQVRGADGAKESYGRVTRLLGEPASEGAGLNPELKARMGWLQARLAFEAGNSEETIRLVEAQLKTPLEVPASLKEEIASILMLLKARAEFALGREGAALASLKALRDGYRKSDAAISSYLIEAEHYAEQDKIDEARNRLILLTDNPDPDYRNNPYFPYALYRLAMLSERLGREENLREAHQRIEDLVNSPAAAGDAALLFAARLRQGDIARKRNDFPAAQRIYEYLVNAYPRRPDVVLAQLALADCHTVQLTDLRSAEDTAHADYAELIYAQLLDRVDAPTDVRVEAGYKLGLLLARRGKTDAAVRVWWTDVIHGFLLKDAKGAGGDARRPYWLARTLYDLGELQEKRGRFDDAKSAYLELIEQRLPYGEALARARLQQLGVPVTKNE